MKSVAFILRGAIAMSNNKYVCYPAAQKSIQKHIFDCNLGYKFDVFLQSWNIDLKQELLDLYNPIAYRFDKNKKYANQIHKKNGFYNQRSMALSFKFGIDLLENQENEYDIVILYRPDMLLWKDIVLDNYTNLEDTIYCNEHKSTCKGDFYFIMNYNNALRFKGLFFCDYLAHQHSWIKSFVKYDLNLNIQSDGIKQHKHIEVIRRLKVAYHDKQSITKEQLEEFGISIEEIDTYNNPDERLIL